MKPLYLAISFPLLLASLFAALLSRKIRDDIRSVQSAIVPHPQTEFTETLTSLLITAEDHRYLAHFGFDPIAIMRAIYRFAVHRKLEGASTIEQQFVRSLTNKHEISAKRKIREIIIASAISRRNRKTDIAYSYLATAYFGHNLIGYNSASKLLAPEGVPTEDTLRHGALIVALLKRPSPSTSNEIWIRRHEARASYITNRHEKYKKTKINYRYAT